jgi:class 3 adenylate cyclase
VLFTDVEGSVALRQSRGDAAAHPLLRGQTEVVRGQVLEHGGHADHLGMPKHVVLTDALVARR